MDKLESIRERQRRNIERQLRKYKNKIVDKHQSAGSFQPSFIENDFDYSQQEEYLIDIL